MFLELFANVVNVLAQVQRVQNPKIFWASPLAPTDFEALQGVRGQSVFFNLALRERNIQVRLYLKVVLKS